MRANPPGSGLHRTEPDSPSTSPAPRTTAQSRKGTRMADTKRIPVLTEAMPAEIASSPPRDECKDREGFNTVSAASSMLTC